MKLFRRKTEEEAVRQEIAVKEAAPFEGLTEAEAAARAAAGWDNRPVEPPTRTTGQIVRENLLTYFNLVFLVLCAVPCGGEGVDFEPFVRHCRHY